MKTELFDFHLPEELIAQEPVKDRDKAKLLVLKKAGEIEHKIFYEIVHYIKKGDVLVLNNTKVIRAKITGKFMDTGGKFDGLFLKAGEGWMEVIVKKAKRARAGRKIVFKDGTVGVVKEILPEGKRVVELEGNVDVMNFIDRVGDVPLPPYIKSMGIKEEDYQTVYARKKGSLASPTAGLHFTEELLEKIKSMGVDILYVTLHVGLGTFRPIRTENIEDHEMEEEWIEVSPEVVEKIIKTKERGGRIFAVGTTVVRSLETAGLSGKFKPFRGYTNLFIKPGFKFNVVDSLITNFHLPKTTLIVLVSAFAGREKIMKAYREAVKKKYRFFSFGDAMLII
ncbi:MAG: tRNA preQ1(34) S-adenosylmethionine ribosyltransferase-isomerase QueA [Caldiserica bacterium]|nr:MAG: tRNA preQ1(34) S-adenosylmethionine ribosyltransferase-isomerase QueA [Caldisericota bacterium]